jgi:hypothetical protein
MEDPYAMDAVLADLIALNITFIRWCIRVDELCPNLFMYVPFSLLLCDISRFSINTC